MDLKNTIDAATLLYGGVVQGKTGIEKIPFYPQKTNLPKASRKDPFVRTSPERAGLSAKEVTALVRALSESRTANVHSLLLLRDGRVVAEACAPGYDIRTPHVAFSFSKTVTGMAIGLLLHEKKLSLDDTIISFFPKEKPFLVSKRMRTLTVRHLLTMSSGVTFSESGAVVEENWVHAFLSSSVRFTPGTAFAYNSMNSYMLSAIVQTVSGQSLTAYLKPRLFDPLDIPDVFWEKCPRGIEKGGWGLYLSVGDMAKFGVLLLNGGVWEGKRLLPEDWVKEATKKQIASGRGCSFDYGYHLWVRRGGDGFLLNGMLGQNTLVLPAKRIVLSMTAGDDTLFQDTPSLVLALSHLEKMTAGRVRGASLLAKRRLRTACTRFRANVAWLSPDAPPRFAAKAERFAEASLKADGIFGAYKALPNSAGLLPILVRLFQNNHTRGIRRVLLDQKEKDIYLTLDEGNGRYMVRASHRQSAESILSVRGEKYLVRAAYEWALDEDRAPILKIHVVFPELSGDRRIVIREKDGSFLLTMSERPGFSFVEKLVGSTRIAVRDNRFLSFVLKKVPIDQLMLRASAVYEPAVRLFPIKKD